MIGQQNQIPGYLVDDALEHGLKYKVAPRRMLDNVLRVGLHVCVDV